MGQRRQNYADRNEFDERIIDITRVAKVVKGGRRFAFRVAVVVGDNKGNIGFGLGKARSVPDAIRKALEAARKDMERMAMVGTTIPHEIIGRHGAAKVLLKPASPGTGVIAGGAMRAVLESAGVHDVLAKSKGSSNPHNVVKATFDALSTMRDAYTVAEQRGIELEKVFNG